MKTLTAPIGFLLLVSQVLTCICGFAYVAKYTHPSLFNCHGVCGLVAQHPFGWYYLVLMSVALPVYSYSAYVIASIAHTYTLVTRESCCSLCE